MHASKWPRAMSTRCRPTRANRGRLRAHSDLAHNYRHNNCYVVISITSTDACVKHTPLEIDDHRTPRSGDGGTPSPTPLNPDPTLAITVPQSGRYIVHQLSSVYGKLLERHAVFTALRKRTTSSRNAGDRSWDKNALPGTLRRASQIRCHLLAYQPSDNQTL